MSSRRDKTRPLLIVVSAPSGAGKSTLCDRLLVERKDIIYSISCTTRAPRGEEENGVDYFFMTEKQFDADVKAGKFLEHAVVHGYKYGTPKKMVYDAMSSGKSVIMDIDVQGARQIRTMAAELPAGDIIRDGYVDIFIAPPSIDVLRERLEKRGEDAPDVIERRVRNAEAEMKCAGEYCYIVVNDDLDVAYGRLKDVLKNETGSKK